jgi:transcription-repair coupling factor (superfamily II helicase)
MERGGQVYFVHNRVESIYSMANLLHRLVPEARVGVGHGQMTESALEQVMVDFVSRKFDVLLATTIIENGIDIPNANTMIVNRADRYGLAQLYQLRGRVGRSDRRAYAYLLIPPEQGLSAVARKRLAAIKEFSDLGSGFRVAALDLEIRGAGNLLGGQQSGHIEAIGFEMYMKLLEEAIRELKGEELEDEVRTSISLKIEVRIDEAYIADTNQRLSVYRRVAQARTDAELDRILDEVRDRFGPLPPSMQVLAGFAQIRLMAERLKIEAIDREGAAVVFRFRQDAPLDPVRLMKFLQARPDVRLLPPATLRMELEPPLRAPRLDSPGRGAGVEPVSRARPAGHGGRDARNPYVGSGFSRDVGSGLSRIEGDRGISGGHAGAPVSWAAGDANVGGGGPGAGRPGGRPAPASWWTVRATAGEVTGGFSKEEILKPVAEDPRAPGGLFDRVGGLLQDLGDLAG